MKRITWIALLPLCLGCTSDRIPDGEIVLIAGQETGIWTQEPRPSALGISKIALDDTETAYTTLAVPTSDTAEPLFQMGRGSPGAFAATATDAGGTPLIRGRTWILDPVSLEGYILGMFVGRVGTFSRPPGAFAVGQGDFPPVEVYGGRFLISMGTVESNQIRIDGYDLGLWDFTYTAFVPCLGDPCPVRSLAVSDFGLAVMVGDTWAGWWNPAYEGSASYGVLPLPKNLPSWGDLARGGTVRNFSDGSAYIVGATRADNPTTAVLYVATTGETKVLNLGTPRAGAAAAWVEGAGLVVVGGSSDPAGSGVEVLADPAANFVPRPFPVDPVAGAGIVAVDGTTLLRAGGLNPDNTPAPSVRLSLACGSACQPEVSGDALDLVRPAGLWLESGDTFWVGTDPEGNMAGRQLGLVAGTTPVPLREPRIGGSVLPASTGQLAVLGGHRPDATPALGLEFYQP